MKKLKFILLVIASLMLSLPNSSAQEISGSWFGAVKINGMPLRIKFNIIQNDSLLTATLVSLDQGNMEVPATKVMFEDSKLTLSVANIGFEYTGEMIADSIIGSMAQGGMKFPLNLTRTAIAKTKRNRPQEPNKPYPYNEEHVFIENGDVTLAGTLTLPKESSKHPAVVLVSGSGAQNRDEELMGHRPFLVIADYLTRNNIAVLRYDDRGFAESTGNFASSTTFDFATDAHAAVNYLKNRDEIDSERIGIIGHSEGGIIAPLVAVDEPALNFIILLAGTGVRGDSRLRMQSELMAEASGVSAVRRAESGAINRQVDDMILQGKNNYEVTTFLNNYKDINTAKQQASISTSPWFRTFVSHDPSQVLSKVNCRVLALNGTKDLQVPSKENLGAIEKALKKGENDRYKIVELEGLNHLFQHCNTGLFNEYSEIEETISPEVLQIMKDFILHD